ncbi:MAG: hypothetical protein AAB577_00155 [Patescibacteria group bacterium]
MQILPTITTTPGAWRDRVKEAGKLKLKEVAIFLTCLNRTERKELYRLLEKTSIKSIPFIHLRDDVTMGEMDYLVKNYQTKVFNTHTVREYPIPAEWGKYRNFIYIENTYQPLDEDEIKKFAGVCVDLSHLENDRLLNQEKYQHDVKIIEKHKVGCSHISVVKDAPIKDENNYLRYTAHFLEKVKEFDYLKKYPLKYFGDFSALELENTIKEQLKAKEHISALLKEKRGK